MTPQRTTEGAGNDAPRLRSIQVAELPITDDAQFIASMLLSVLSAEQVTELVRILQDPTE